MQSSLQVRRGTKSRLPLIPLLPRRYFRRRTTRDEIINNYALISEVQFHRWRDVYRILFPCKPIQVTDRFPRRVAAFRSHRDNISRVSKQNSELSISRCRVANEIAVIFTFIFATRAPELRGFLARPLRARVSRILFFTCMTE